MKMYCRKREKGQAIVEYIIIVVIVAIAALAVMGIFSDTIKEKISGAVSELSDSKKGEAQEAAEQSSADRLKSMKADGFGDSSSGN